MNKAKIKIALTGPESTGKSVLAFALSRHYGATLVKEYSRTYYATHPFENKREEIIEIAKGQIKAEEDALEAASTLIICDSDLLNIKIWLEYYDYEVPSFIMQHLAAKTYDFSLLLYPNTPWEEDPLRKNPNDRLALFKLFKQQLENLESPYEIVNGLGEQRLQQAIGYIADRFKI